MTTMKMIGCALIAVGLLPGVLAATTPRTNVVVEVAVEQANAFLDRTERDLDMHRRAGDSEPLARETRTAVQRKLHFVRRELAKLGDDAAVVVARVDALMERVSGTSTKMDGTGVIEGRVTAMATGLPISGVVIELREFTGGFIAGSLTDSSGAYRFGLLPADSYRLRTTAPAPWADELYDGLPCFGGCDTDDGTPVDVDVGQVMSGIDFALRQTGAIEGTVRDAATGTPIPFLEVRRDGGGPGFPYVMTNIDGAFSFTGLSEAENVTVFTNSERRLLDQVFDGIPCLNFLPFDCDPVADGTPIPVMLDQVVSGIDFALEPGGTIQGRVRAADTGVGVRNWRVVLFNDQGQEFHEGYSDELGQYAIRGLPPGTYYAVAQKGNDSTPFVDMLHDGQLCPIPPGSGGCDPLSGTPIQIEHNGVRTVDFALPRRGSISGTVVDADSGQPLAGIPIDLVNEFGIETRRVVTVSDGSFRFESVVPIVHRALTAASDTDYLDEVYAEIACDPYCDGNQGQPINVAVDTETTGVDFTLERGGVIEGRVIDAQTGEGLRSERVVLVGAGTGLTNDHSDSLGRFRLRRLRADEYRVFVSATDFLPEAWDNVHCPPEGCVGMGDPIAAVPGQLVTGIEIALDRGGAIQGRIVDAVTGDDAVGASRVLVWDESGAVVGNGFVSSGEYRVTPLRPGRYRLSTASNGTYIDQAWPGEPCPSLGCDGTQGALIEVGFNSVIDGIDLALEPIGCQATATAMCLNDQRFRVQIDWRAPQGDMGAARPEQLTRDSGFFWFFDQDNVEAVVKVLDACDTSVNRFWVFAAGLTNVEAIVRVTDTWTNTERVYTNPLGTPFAPIQDTQAFATCDAPSPTGTVVPFESSGDTFTTKPPLSKGGCAFGPATLCLDNDRFAIRARWTNAMGATGEGLAGFLTNDTGYFYFFDPDNVEVLVKVLDACSSPVQRFWVFAGGLTNVEVELEVLDTVTDEVRIYSNPLGMPFAPIQDTQAFDTCP